MLVTLCLIGIVEARFVGDLSDEMKQHPELISWGMSEVAAVRAFERDDLIGISVNWESARVLEVTCVSIEFVEPTTSPRDR